MKGYFSQLARHTGLKFDPHRKTAGEDSSSEPVVGGNASPFEIHDVTFTGLLRTTTVPGDDAVAL